MVDHDFEISFPEDRGERDLYFAFTGFSDEEVTDMTIKVEKMGAFVLTDPTWSEMCTHVISRTFAKTELVLAGLAGGRWVLKQQFIFDSSYNKSWARARNYVHDEIVICHRKNWKRLDVAGGAFYNMKALFVLDDVETKEVYQRIVDAGGGQWVAGDLRKAREKRFDGDQLTHIIIDPWVLEQNDWRYNDFKDWGVYERNVSRNSREDGYGPNWRNGGMLFKVHYTFLMDKLLHPLENIREIKYNIFEEKVQKEAKVRRRQKRKMKVNKFEKLKHRSESPDMSSDEDDLVVIKERYQEEKRKKQPGRFYIEKSSSHAKETFWEREARRETKIKKGGRKREKSPDLLVANLGYMESNRKKNKRSGGSQIQADPSKHFKNGPDGVYVDTDQLLGDHDIAPMESLQNSYIKNLQKNLQDIESSHKRFSQGGLQRGEKDKWMGSIKSENDSKFGIKQEKTVRFQSSKKVFKKEVVVDVDSDSDIEEVPVEHTKPVKSEQRKFDHYGQKGIITIDDDDEVQMLEDALPPGIVVLHEKIKPEVDDIVYLPPDEKKDESEIEDLDVKDIRLMEVDADCKTESDDEIEIISCETEDRKPDLGKLLKLLGPLPEIHIESSDSEDDLENESVSSDIVPLNEVAYLPDVEDIHVISEAIDRESTRDVLTLESEAIDRSPIRDDLIIESDIEMEDSIEESNLEIERFIANTSNNAIVSKDLDLPQNSEVQSNIYELPLLKQVTSIDKVPETKAVTLKEKCSSSFEASETRKNVSDVDHHSPKQLPLSQLSPKPLTPNQLLPQLNLTLLERQRRTAEHISISNVSCRTPTFDKHSLDKKSSELVQVNTRTLMEFTRLNGKDDISLTRRKTRQAGRRRKVKRNEVDIEDDYFDEECDLVKVLKILDSNTSSINYPHPQILNTIFDKFFMNQNSPFVIKKAQDYLSIFFLLHFGDKGTNRMLLMDVLLNSLRKVSDGNLFKTFDRNNSRDILCVWKYFQAILNESENMEKEINGHRELLKLLVKVLQRDFELWWKHERRRDSFPMLYYAFGGSDFLSNSLNTVQFLYRGALSRTVFFDPWYIRRLVSMVAMLTAYMDDKDNQGFVLQGCKVPLARALAKEFCIIESPSTLGAELYLLQPNWFSYLVCKQIVEIKSKKKRKISSLGDLTKMFKELTVQSNEEEEIVSEMCVQKYFSFNYSHVLLRANWFFEICNTNQKFETFMEMRKLTKNKSKKSEDDVFQSRNCIKITTKQQLKDLKTLTKYSSGSELVSTKSGALRSILFNMETAKDQGWHPGLVVQ